MKSILQEQKAITLIALVITIVVMLILAGVTINLTLGENGIFTTAQRAAKNYTEAQNKELEELNDFESLVNNSITNGEESLNGSWSNSNKVNKPNLANTGLTPVTINSNGTYGIPNIEEDSWYSYDGTTNKWANARTKDGSMWVWIPRFAYKITYTDSSNKSLGGTIEVVFLQGTTNKDYNGNDVTSESYIDEKGAIGAYIVHPAFQDGTDTGFTNGEWDSEIPGFWMAKFEAGYVGKAGDTTTATDSIVSYSTIAISSTEDFTSNYYGERAVGTLIKYPTFQANRASMNYIGISDAYDLCKSIQNAKDVYGLTNIDSHMTKNSEWGAVAYLTHSKYGRNGEEVVLNNLSLNNTTSTVYAITGYGAKASAGDNSKMVTTTWKEIENGTQEGSWLTTQGQTASTTKNIYGIYDLSGGTWEWTAGYIATTGNYETYGGSLKGDSSKHKTKYAYSATGVTDTENYNENLEIIGDAIIETSNSKTGSNSWNVDYSYFPWSSAPFFLRGGCWGDSSVTGLFAFSRDYGYGYLNMGFRAILVPVLL